MKAAVISEKGSRQEMEDAHFLDLDFAGRGWVFGGVYDGHGGATAADYAARRLHQVFLEALFAGASPQRAFVQSYKTTSLELSTQDSGTTAVDFFIREGVIFTANAGDARAIVIGKRSFHQLTTDHRLDDPSERERIERMGGSIIYPYTYRGNRGLMPTRTIGDEYFRPVGIIATPSVNEHRIAPDDAFLVAACDGVFDFMTNEEVAALARHFDEPEPLIQALRNEVLISRGGTDNLSAIVVSLRD